MSDIEKFEKVIEELDRLLEEADKVLDENEKPYLYLVKNELDPR